MAIDDNRYGRAIETRRLLIEPLQIAHVPELFALLKDPKIYTFIPEEPPVSEDSLRARCERLIRGPGSDADQRWFNWTLRTKANRAVVGTVQATIETIPQRVLVAYIVGPEFWGQGFGSEGLDAVLGWLLADPSIKAVNALVDTRNMRSIRLLEKRGFVVAETITGAAFFKGARSDEFRFRLSQSQMNVYRSRSRGRAGRSIGATTP